ncbi:DUF2540 domain-containing protein [Methanocaldococcus sp.]|uniref:DUF2540 domain-containing protein n=1 Tax=Methanocaldococcus sp. TaxID=2152917 RepID=UPI0026188A42|nr:DUF2540 domain-containing protein [Methanocaldococcus sp.]MCQ6254733.1 DUF2540 domain-containing protein [Methanocaldococcus sp.]
MKVTFYLYKNIDSRQLRYHLHKLEDLKQIDPEKLKKVVEARKRCKRTIILTEEERKIYQRFGKATNLYLNYVILVNEDGERT